MKRDMDLVRNILRAVEEKGDLHDCIDLEIAGHSKEEVLYHVRLLREAGLLEVADLSGLWELHLSPKRLTWSGHDFLDAAKNDTVWNNAKEIVKDKGGSIPFEVLKALLIKLASSLVGLG